jgi:hypothetical protein
MLHKVLLLLCARNGGLLPVASGWCVSELLQEFSGWRTMTRGSQASQCAMLAMHMWGCAAGQEMADNIDVIHSTVMWRCCLLTIENAKQPNHLPSARLCLPLQPVHTRLTHVPCSKSPGPLMLMQQLLYLGMVEVLHARSLPPQQTVPKADFAIRPAAAVHAGSTRIRGPRMCMRKHCHVVLSHHGPSFSTALSGLVLPSGVQHASPGRHPRLCRGSHWQQL